MSAVRESGHTPGPWTSEAGSNTGRRIIAPNAPKTRRVVAACGGKDREANARLIAAAPDMYEALKQAREWLSGWASADLQLAIIDAALAKVQP